MSPRVWMAPLVLGCLLGTGCGRRDRASDGHTSSSPAPSHRLISVPASTGPEQAAAPQQQAPPSPATAPSVAGSTPPDAVRAVQERLVELGFAPGYPDGRLGPDTRSAIRDFQRASALHETGRLDAKTLATLFGSETAEDKIQRVRGQDAPGAAPHRDDDPPVASAFGFGLALGFLGAVLLALFARSAKARPT